MGFVVSAGVRMGHGMVEDSTTAFEILGKDYSTKAMRLFFRAAALSKVHL
jgi:hypothetical protein